MNEWQRVGRIINDGNKKKKKMKIDEDTIDACQQVYYNTMIELYLKANIAALH